MIVPTIKIYSPNERPYGPLSNNAIHKMRIDGVTYDNVTKYIYSNMLVQNSHKTILRNFNGKPHEIKSEFDKLIEKELKSVYMNALIEDKSLEERFNDNESLKHLLLKTGNADIHYISNNTKLGIKNGKGDNLYGKALEQLRQTFQNDYNQEAVLKQKKEYEQNLYETYIIYKELTDKITNGGDDLREFNGQTVASIIRGADARGSMLDFNEIKNKYPSQEIVIEQLHNKMVAPPRQQRPKDVDSSKTQNDPLLETIINSQVKLSDRKQDLSKLESIEYGENENPKRRPISRFTKSSSAPKQSNLVPLSTHIDQDIYNILENPNALIPLIRKKYIKNYQEYQKRLRRSVITDIFLTDTIKRQYPELEKNKYAQQIFKLMSSLTLAQVNEIYTKLDTLYTNKNLPENVQTEIDSALANIKIPTDQEVIQIQSYELPKESRQKSNLGKVYLDKSGVKLPTFEIYADETSLPKDSKESLNHVILSPRYDGYDGVNVNSLLPLFTINGRKFPTISHYLVFKLFEYYNGGQISVAYNSILSENAKQSNTSNKHQDFIDVNILDRKLNNYKEEVYVSKLKHYANKGLIVKFEDRVLQDILLLTRDAHLIWDDRNDPILGSGRDKTGQNYVGKEWESLRDVFSLERQRETLEMQQFDVNYIDKMLIKDAFFKAWIMMKISDMCKTLGIVKNYVYEKYEKDLNATEELNGEFAANVLDNIYQPCSNIYLRTSQIKSPVTEEFRSLFFQKSCNILGLSKPFYLYKVDPSDQSKKIVIPDSEMSEDQLKEVKKNNESRNQRREEIIEVIWKRIAVLLYLILNVATQQQIFDIRMIIVQSEEILSDIDSPCLEQDLLSNPKDNCILSALINVITGLRNFNMKTQLPVNITEVDITAASNIIMGKDISDDITKNIVEGDESEDQTILKTIDTEDSILPFVHNQDEEQGDDDEDADDEGNYPDLIDFGDEDDEGGSKFPTNKLETMLYSKMSQAPSKTIENHLVNIFGQNVENPEQISKLLIGAVNTIKTIKLVSRSEDKNDNLKSNRINFFATQRLN
jgi:predicted NAD-dependent protein-ADP-ribosyltransferase YbiA (DUF1768 family)